MKKKCFAILISCFVFLASGCGGKENDDNVVIVYNWGEYVDPEMLALFEEETGIRVIYDEFETNETMFPKVEAGAAEYDVVCPSDYMIHKMIQNDLLAELDFDRLPNAKQNIGAQYWQQSEEFDPGNRYSVPYCWGTVGILYNKTMVDEPITSWAQLWDEKYRDEILMQDSVRDAFMVAEKAYGYSMNTLDEQELLTVRGHRRYLFRRGNLYQIRKQQSGICNSRRGDECLD